MSGRQRERPWRCGHCGALMGTIAMVDGEDVLYPLPDTYERPAVSRAYRVLCARCQTPKVWHLARRPRAQEAA